MTLHHVVDDRAWVVRSGFPVHRDRHRDLTSGSDEPGRRTYHFGRDVIQGAEFVFVTPAAPVLHSLEYLVELAERDPRGLSQSGHHFARLPVDTQSRRRVRPSVAEAKSIRSSGGHPLPIGVSTCRQVLASRPPPTPSQSGAGHLADRKLAELAVNLSPYRGPGCTRAEISAAETRISSRGR